LVFGDLDLVFCCSRGAHWRWVVVNCELVNSSK
jgi:hypothetical protein